MHIIRAGHCGLGQALGRSKDWTGMGVQESDLFDFYFANQHFFNRHHFLYLQLFSTLFQI